MKHSTGRITRSQELRFERMREIGCIACWKEGHRDLICGASENHHLNFDGKAGQRRLGHDFSIPLGQWHHQGIPKPGIRPENMALLFGPSLRLQSKKFRETYGSDSELLAETNRLIGEQT